MKILFRKTILLNRFGKGVGSALRVRKHPFGTNVQRVGPLDYEELDIDWNADETDNMTIAEIEELMDATQDTIDELEALLVAHFEEW